MGFPGGTSGKKSSCQCRRFRRCRFNPWVGRISGEGHGNPLQYSCLENPMDRGGYSPWGHNESDLTEHPPTHTYNIRFPNQWEWRQRLLVSSLSEIRKKHSKDQDLEASQNFCYLQFDSKKSEESVFKIASDTQMVQLNLWSQRTRT